MIYQLESTIKQSVLAGEKMIEIYQALECLARHSFMAPHLKAKYPDLLDLTAADVKVEGGLSASRKVTIIKEGHPLKGLIYLYYTLGFKRDLEAAYTGLVGYFKDPEETVLKYVRKELF